METNQEFVDKWLDRAVQDFDRNPRCAQLIRRLAEENPDSFATAVVRQFGQSGQSAALRYLATLLARDKSVFETLSEPGSASKERSHSALRRILAVDPSFDVKLAKQLPDSTGANHGHALKGARGARALDLLDKNSQSEQVVPILSHLVDSEDPRLSAGTALLVGRRTHNPEWVERLLGNDDARVRANAVESLWGEGSAGAHRVLEAAQTDESNRVVGNSLVGLNRMGDPGVLEQVIRMAENPSPRFRATAAWAMGMIGHNAFLPYLTAMVRDGDEAVRRVALRSLIGLRRAEGEKPTEKPAEKPPEATAAEPAVETPDMIFDLRLDGSNFSARPSGDVLLRTNP